MSDQRAAKVPRLLVVTANGNNSNSYTLDWLDAYKATTQANTTHVDLLHASSLKRLEASLATVDGVVLLHSVTADDLTPLAGALSQLQDRRVPLCVLVGNEINLPWAPMSLKIRLFEAIDPQVIGTQLLQEAGDYLYASLGSERVLSVPHAVDPVVLEYRRPRESSTLRIGTRSVKYLPLLGDSQRERIFAGVKEGARPPQWISDFSSSRLGREDWRQFLTSLDVAVGTEAGSFYTSPDDSLVTRILEDARTARRGASIRIDGRARKFTRRLPWKFRETARRWMPKFGVVTDLDLLANLDREAVIRKYFDPERRAPVNTKAISSRHLEAAALGTPQLLTEGRYNDILIPGEHYIAVRHDLSNLDEALIALSDVELRRHLSRSARQLVCLDHTLEHRIAQINARLFGLEPRPLTIDKVVG
jgi:hypothetical protein